MSIFKPVRTYSDLKQRIEDFQNDMIEIVLQYEQNKQEAVEQARSPGGGSGLKYACKGSNFNILSKLITRDASQVRTKTQAVVRGRKVTDA